jgi:hypothetical protein
MKKIIRKISFPLLLMGASLVGNAQTTWYFGTNAGVKFNGSGTPTFLGGSAMNTSEGCTGLVDKNNNVILYTDGDKVWNGLHQEQPTGGTTIHLKGSASGTQTALVVPVPCDTTRAFIFTTNDAEHAYGNGDVNNTLGLRASLVSVAKSGSSYLINLIEENIQLTPANMNVGEKMEMVEDGNGGYWILTHGLAVYDKHPSNGGTEFHPGGSGKNFYAFHVTSGIANTTALKATLVTTVITSASITEHKSWSHPGGDNLDLTSTTFPAQINGQGQLAILKKDATTAIVACALPFFGNVWGTSKWRVKPVCQLYSLNLATGAIATSGINAPIEFDLNFNNTDGTAKDGCAYGLALSTDGTNSYLYATSTAGSGNFFATTAPYTYATSRLYRYNITAWNAGTIAASQFKIKENVQADASYGYGALQRGPNGRIYVANKATNTLGEIQTPNDPTNPNFVENSVNWASTNPSAFCRSGLPTTILMAGPTTPSINFSACKRTVAFTTKYTGTAPNSYYWEIYGCNAAGQPVNAGGSNVYSTSLSFFYETSNVSGTYTAGTPPATLPSSINTNGTCNRYYKAVLYVKSVCGTLTKMVTTNAFKLVCNDPNFSNVTSTTDPNFWTVISNLNDLTAGNNAGYNYGWRLQDLDASGNVIFTIGPDNWWIWTDPCHYRGFDQTVNNYTTPINDWQHLPSNLPADGKLLYGHNYRFTHMSYNDACPTPKYFSFDASYPHNKGSNDQQVVFTEYKGPFDFDMNQQTMGIKINESKTDMFSVYPNPSSGIFTIELSDEDKAIMEVIDITGKVIKTAQLNKSDNYTLDLSGYAKGAYMIKMNGSQQQLQKIIVE